MLVVSPDNRLLGTFTDGDLRRTLQSRGALVMQTRVEEVMNTSPRTCESGAKAIDAMQAGIVLLWEKMFLLLSVGSRCLHSSS